MKVLAADGISPKGIELLQKEFEVDVRDKISAEELLEIIPQYDALMVRSASKVTAEVINRAEKLKIIGRAGVGVDNIDIPAATAKGIIVINSPGGNTIAATEHTMAMMLAMSRNIPVANETMQKGELGQSKANNLLRLYNHQNKSLELKNVLSDGSLRAGQLIKVEFTIPHEKFNHWFMIKKCEHTVNETGILSNLTLQGGEFGG